MKRLFVLAILAMLLCGCSSEPIYEKVGFEDAATFPTETVEEFPLLDMSETDTVTQGNIGDYVTTFGRFYITVDGEESYSNGRDDPKPFLLTFDDFETGETYPICTQPQCLHDTPTCGAYFSLATGQPECFYYDGEYLYFYLGGEESLYRQRLDGTDREKLFSLSSYSVDILYEGKFAYCLGLIMEKDDETGQVITRRRLSQLNLETGEQTELPFSFEGNLSEVSLLDKYGDELVMRYTYSLDTLIPFQDISKTRHMIFLLNMETGKITRLLDDLSTYSATASCPGYRIYAVFDEKSEKSLQYRDGEWSAFSGDIFIFDLQKRVCYRLIDQLCLTWEFSIYDGKLFYCDLKNDGTALENKIRDLSTGEVIPWYFWNSEMELNRIAVFEDFFIVRKRGDTETYYRISKEDYYAGIPNLVPLTELQPQLSGSQG